MDTLLNPPTIASRKHSRSTPRPPRASGSSKTSRPYQKSKSSDSSSSSKSSKSSEPLEFSPFSKSAKSYQSSKSSLNLELCSVNVRDRSCNEGATASSVKDFWVTGTLGSRAFNNPTYTPPRTLKTPKTPGSSPKSPRSAHLNHHQRKNSLEISYSTIPDGVFTATSSTAVDPTSSAIKAAYDDAKSLETTVGKTESSGATAQSTSPRLPRRHRPVLDTVLSSLDLYNGSLTLQLGLDHIEVTKTHWHLFFKQIVNKYNVKHDIELRGTSECSHIEEQLGALIDDSGCLERDKVIRLFKLEWEFRDVWDQFWSGRQVVAGCWITKPCKNRFAYAVSHIKAGGALPRRLDCKYRNNDKATIRGEDITDIFNTNTEPIMHAKSFEQLLIHQDPAVFHFLECWVENSKGNDDALSIIARTVRMMWAKYDLLIPSRVNDKRMNDISVGNIAATVICSSSHNLQARLDGRDILVSLFQSYGHPITYQTFSATIQRLNLSDMVVAFMMFAFYFNEIYIDNDTKFEGKINDLLQELGHELWIVARLDVVERLDDDSAPSHQEALRLSTCFLIVLYIANQEAWFRADHSTFNFVMRIIQVRLGECGLRSIWNCIGMGEAYAQIDEDAIHKLISAVEYMGRVPEPRLPLAEMDGTPIRQELDSEETISYVGMQRNPGVSNIHTKASVMHVPVPQQSFQTQVQVTQRTEATSSVLPALDPQLSQETIHGQEQSNIPHQRPRAFSYSDTGSKRHRRKGKRKPTNNVIAWFRRLHS